ncbi:MAG: hypothetical protein KJN90_10370 [Gammaproteobacteria bacterium]|nr:hypothetical protein [Gammaproteobacteria bacterium]
MWPAVNQALNAMVDVWLWPVQSLDAIWQIIALALPATVIALLVFRLVSNQEGIREQKDKIKAYLLEMLLYKDDLRVTMSAQHHILGHSLRYMGYALLPMAVMLLPFILIMVQLESRLAFQGLDPGDTTILAVTVDAQQQRVKQTDYRLELPVGLAQETPAMRVPATGEVVWRIRAESPGDYTVTILAGERTVKKRMVVDAQQTHLATSVYRADDFRTLGFPAEPALAADQPLIDVSVQYPRARGEFIGLSSASWLLFLFSIIFGFALRGVLGVTF